MGVEGVCMGVEGIHMGVEGIHMGVEGVHMGVEGVHVGVEGVHVGVEGVHVGVEGVHVGVEGVHMGVEGIHVGVEGVCMGVEGVRIGVEAYVWVLRVYAWCQGRMCGCREHALRTTTYLWGVGMDEGRAKGEGMGVGVGEKVPSGLHLRRAPIHRRFSLSPLPVYPYPKMCPSFPAHWSPISGATSNSAPFFSWAVFPGWDTLLPAPLVPGCDMSPSHLGSSLPTHILGCDTSLPSPMRPTQTTIACLYLVTARHIVLPLDKDDNKPYIL
ncbi:hypothetical protein DFH94DRAFT_680364 [Russula ochroleuca]|uniref:Uncharacterized protein n=1 Tax=Russula ochroleuca TaxID=152965 RepID=A0A9P5TBT4_9AGAM|nr:hypothetical protein DFH94DRAFT_680364 [Russula ochroleuca]